MDIWGYLLEFSGSLVFYDASVGLSGIINNNLQINGVLEFLEARHDVVVGGKALWVVFGLKWFHQDGIGVDVKGHHDVVVAAMVSNWEAAYVVLVDLSDGFNLDE